MYSVAQGVEGEGEREDIEEEIERVWNGIER
jgi:hypothetical protein